MSNKTLKERTLSLTLPIFLETLSLMSLSLIDTLMLSQLSDESVAAVGLVNQILIMIFLLFFVGSTGCLVVCSQYLGARRMHDFLETAKVSLLLNGILGLVVSVLLFRHADVILRCMNTQSSLWEDALSYCTIVGGFAFLPSLTFACASILRSREMAKYPMYVSFITNIVNVIANYALIFGHLGCPELKVEGAAWATVLSRLVGLLVLVLFVVRRGMDDRPNGDHSPNPAQKLLQILRIGAPGAGEMFSYSFSQVVITYFINMLGAEALAARTYIASIAIIDFIFAISLSQAVSITAGHMVGKHKYRAAKSIGEFSIRRAILVSFLLSITLAVLSPFFMGYLTQNKDILSLSLTIFWIDIVLEIGRAVNILTSRLLAAVGDPLFPLKVSIIVVWSVATLGGYVAGIALGFGLIGMWCMFLVDESLRATIQWWYWKKAAWMNKSIC